ncbi:hypothetical protein PNOK_0759400 [Pyrrhoderma noxium]|uniref:DUF6534 domain-containing protein n=1 Tax=Pyrrhoderma noxium TaxID=2282107 RepID=A0A286UDC3_9AGAM|nr:hypothetical protein PNOK_0759400 [Pyrrhoderma noxium]
MSNSTTATIVPVLDNTMGVLFVGVLLGMALWGAGCVQVYYYYNRYPKDELWIKCLVFVVWALDTTHQGMITHTAYTYLVTEYGNLNFLGIIVPTLLYEVIISAIICLFVQSFFVLRIWKLSHKNIYITVVLLALVLAEFLSCAIYTEKALKLKTYQNLAKIVNLSRTINVLSAASDVAIAMALIWLLQQSRTGFRRSDNMINRLILFSLNTGLLTSLDAIMSLVTITVFPTTFIYIMFFVTISRLYTNSLMATLNSRKSLSGGLGDESTGDASSNQRYRARAVEIEAPSTLKFDQGINSRGLSIKVNTESETMRDENVKRSAPSADSETDVHYFDDSKSAYPMSDM